MSADRLVAALLLLVGLIHWLPVSAVLGGEWLVRLYGIQPETPDLAILLRHRAVLFALVGGVLVAAAFHPPWRELALLMGLASVLSFLLIARLEGGGSAPIQRVVRVDIVALVALLAAAVLQLRQPG
jgi:hypothetical protein